MFAKWRDESMKEENEKNKLIEIIKSMDDDKIEYLLTYVQLLLNRWG